MPKRLLNQVTNHSTTPDIKHGVKVKEVLAQRDGIVRRLAQVGRQIDHTRRERHAHVNQRVVTVGQQVLGLARVDARDADQQVSRGAQRQLYLTNVQTCCSSTIGKYVKFQ